MEDKEKKLYPLKFAEDKRQMPWGEVNYKIADLGSVDSMVWDGWLADNSLSELMGTYMERVVGDDAFEYYGLQFPVLIKSFRTDSWQPLQVNVPDAEAEARYDSLGKTALWYVLKADPDSEIHLGLKRDVAPEEFYRRCLDSNVTEVLNVVHPKSGDLFIIEPGTVFAAGPGLTVVEISECSEMTFNLMESADLEEAFDMISFSKYIPAPDGLAKGTTVPSQKVLAERDEFKVTRMDLQNPLHIFSDQPGPFAVYHCVKGEAVLKQSSEEIDFQDVTIKEGDVVLLPSEVNDYFLFPMVEGTTLLETVVERRVDPDSYTGDARPSGDTVSDAPDPHIRHWN